MTECNCRVCDCGLFAVYDYDYVCMHRYIYIGTYKGIYIYIYIEELYFPIHFDAISGDVNLFSRKVFKNRFRVFLLINFKYINGEICRNIRTLQDRVENWWGIGGLKSG